MTLKMLRLAAFVFLAFVVTACNIGIKAPSSSNLNDAAATIVAQTLQAATESASKGVIANTPAPFASPNSMTPTSTSTAPILTINNPTNCRSGPGTNFQLITAFNPGTKLTILGKDTADNYWLVQLPQSQDTCWASGEYATASGNFASLPDVTPTAGAANGVPTAPVFQNVNGWTYYCRGTGQTDITLSWIDRANNETGYRIYRNGNVVAELPANSTSYAETITLLSGQSVSYQIEAYNSYGAARSGVATMTCP